MLSEILELLGTFPSRLLPGLLIPAHCSTCVRLDRPYSYVYSTHQNIFSMRLDTYIALRSITVPARGKIQG